MKQILNYIRDTLLVIAGKALLLMLSFNLIVASRFEILKLTYGEAFLAILSIYILFISNYKSYVMHKLDNIDASIRQNNNLVSDGNGVRYALGVTLISNLLSLKNKIVGKEPDSENIEDGK